MKVRPSVLLFALVSAAVIALIMWPRKKPTAETPPAAAETNAVPASAQPKKHGGGSAPRTSTLAAQAATTTSAPATPAQATVERTREGLAAFNDVPIVFYGRVEDQFSNAVAYATVNFNVRVYNGARSGVDRGQTVSDGNGFFKISGYKGESLGVAVERAGYAFVSMNGSGIYSTMWPESQRAHPDPNNPVIIKMWKLQGAQPLVAIAKECKLPFTGAPLFFDLVTGAVSDRTGGDLQIVITRAPGLLSKRNPGDWSIQFKPVSGGIVETDAAAYRVTYQAPADGYQDSYRVEMNHEDRAWFDNIQRVFFLTSRNGQVYSKFHVDFAINDAPDGSMWFQFKGVANTNSSGNWEATAPQ